MKKFFISIAIAVLSLVSFNASAASVTDLQSAQGTLINEDDSSVVIIIIDDIIIIIPD